jgi:transcriptional regulator with XRE-family HTH domain
MDKVNNMENYFSDNIALLRKVKGLTQTQLAEVIGKKKSIIGPYERGEIEPDITSLIKISDFFGIPITDLIQKNLEIDIHLNGLPSVKEPFDNKYIKELSRIGKHEKRVIGFLTTILNEIQQLRHTLEKMSTESGKANPQSSQKHPN